MAQAAACPPPQLEPSATLNGAFWTQFFRVRENLEAEILLKGQGAALSVS